MSLFLLSITSPDGELFNGQVSKLCVRGEEGELAILARHTPFVTSIKPCKLKIELEDGSIKMADIQKGLLTVTKDETTILTGSLEWTE